METRIKNQSKLIVDAITILYLSVKQRKMDELLQITKKEKKYGRKGQLKRIQIE